MSQPPPGEGDGGEDPEAGLERSFNAELTGVSNGNPITDALRKFEDNPYDPQKLTLGIATSMFTALMGSRALVTLMYGGRRKIAHLPI